MKLVILAVGKGRSSPEQGLVQTWLSRIPSGASVIEIESKITSGAGRSEDEGARLLRHLPVGAPLVVCDPRGHDTSSEALASLLGEWRDEGQSTAYFAIGGADGHSPALIQRAAYRIAFGSATWPHMLFRAMLAEQLYRATSILAGHPYHRGG